MSKVYIYFSADILWLSFYPCADLMQKAHGCCEKNYVARC